jgi:site-specific DNA-methyltransferase (adenine-specific)
MATRTVVQGDCLEVMKTLPDKSVDLFVCDLPYGCLTNQTGESRGFFRESQRGTNLERKLSVLTADGCAWDIKLDLTQFWAQVKRLCKNDHTPVLMFCNAKFGYELIKSNEDWFRYDLVWEKTSAVGFLQANKMPMRSHELIYVFAKKGATYYRTDIDVEGAREWKQFGTVGVSGVYDLVRDNPVVRPVGTITSQAGRRCVKSVITIPNKKGRGKHPTQKPDDLYEWLITRYSKEGDTVLDPTAGSFASVNTAVRLGRNAIGIEKDGDFFQRFSSGERPK